MSAIRREHGTRAALLPAAIVLALALVIASINPVGYIGGGSDDWQYLEAARCIAREGVCVPQSHWAARLPLVLPTAAILAALGESRAHIMLVPIAYGLAAIALFVAVVQRAAGRTGAALAGVALVATPMVGGELTALNVSTVEFFWAIAAAFAFQRALGARHRGWAALAGAALALALLSRATAFAFLPILGLGAILLRKEDRALILPAALGLAAVLLLEAGLYAALAGDPLHNWTLSLGHTRLASSEGAAVAGSPLFNPAVIAGWERSMGIQVHWTVDGALNLLADPAMAPNLWAALVALFLARGSGRLRAPLLLFAAACLYFGALTYGLAIDPKPRMFVPIAAAAAGIFGLCAARIWHQGARSLVLLILGVLALNTAAIAYNKIDLRRLESTAAGWVAPDMAVDATGRRVLTLVPAVRHLPALPAPHAERLLGVSTGACVAKGWRLVRQARFGMTDPAPLAALRARGLGLGPVQPLALCEFRRDRAATPRS